MGATWRLLVEDGRDGAWNMAVDRAVQLCRDAGEVPPTLRLYRWATPTVSLGRFQAAETVDGDACDELGIDVVRRPTGGRGVLHDDEVTYSCVAGVSDGVPRGVSASYRYLSAGLVDAYRRLGLAAAVTRRPRGERHAGACYLHASPADVSLGTAKLAGSAQVWFGDTCLQHGSVTRSRDVSREARVFRLTDVRAAHLARHAATLETVLGEVPGVDRIVERVIEGFASALGVEFEPGSLEQCELAIAEQLECEMSIRRGTLAM